MDAFGSLEEALQFDSLRAPKPGSWLALCDVVNSTAAISSGRYKEINALAVAFINALRRFESADDLAFVFGGDGAVCLLNSPDLGRVRAVLNAIGELAKSEFGLTIRTGMAPVEWLERESGRKFYLSRYRESRYVAPYIFCGGVSEYADSLLKQGRLDPPPGTSELHHPVDLQGNWMDGFECRWETVESGKDSVGAFIFMSRAPTVDGQLLDYRHVLELAGKVYGDFRTHAHPILESALRLTLKGRFLRVEEGIRTFGRRRLVRWIYPLFLRLQSVLGTVLMTRRIRIGGINWGNYRADLVANADIRKVDDSLRFVVAGDHQTHKEFEERLLSELGDLAIHWGSAYSKRALLTCMISNYEGEHFHFVDGEDGGYARAAKMLKEKLRTPSTAVG